MAEARRKTTIWSRYVPHGQIALTHPQISFRTLRA